MIIIKFKKAFSMNYRLTDHAEQEMVRRDIPRSVVEALLNSPEHIVEVEEGRKAYQSLVDFEGKMYVVRAIVEHEDPICCRYCIQDQQNKEVLERS